MEAFEDPLGVLKAPAASAGSPLSGSSLLSSAAAAPALAAPPPPHAGGGSAAGGGGVSALVRTVVSEATVALSIGSGTLGAGGASSSSSAAPAAAAASAASAASAPPASPASPYLDWPARRGAILKEYTVSGRFALSAAFLSDDADADAAEEVAQPLAKARQRLEALEAAARGAQTVEMSQGDYVRRIERLHRGLQAAWAANHRVTALKASIQCAKLLGEHRVPQFYPSMFVMVTEILDTFGRLVFERLKAIADDEYRKLGNRGSLPEAFIAADVGAEARETCRNWMYKTSCIRELLPRLYVEMALLECYRFIYDADFAAILLRLIHSIRGVANPLVAAYARLYLARMSAKLVRDDNRQRESMLVAVSDFLVTFKAAVVAPARLRAMEAQHGLSPATYLHLFAPALSWQLHQLGWGAGRDAFQAVLGLYRDHCGEAMVLQAVLEAFDPAFFSPHTADIVRLIADAAPSALASRADLFRALAVQLLRSHPPLDACADLLRAAWAAFDAVAEPVAFARNAAALADLLLACYGSREVLMLLGELARRMQRFAAGGGGGEAPLPSAAPRRGGGGGGGGSSALHAPAAALPYLERVLTALVEHEVAAAATAAASASAGGGSAPAMAARMSAAITSEHFTALLDMFSPEARPALCRRLLAALVSVPGRIEDPVLVNTMQEVARTCHDSLDVLSSDDEQRIVGKLICAFIAKVDLGRDLERQLDLFVDCRQAFHSMDTVKAALCSAAGELALKAHRLVRGAHSAKTAAFVKSVLAFVTITVPGIDDPLARMALYLAAARVALVNCCVGQSDMLFKSFIQEVPELPAALAAGAAAAAGAGAAAAAAAAAAADARVVTLLRDFAAAIVPMPGHPEQGGLYLVRGMANAIARYPFTSAPALRAQATALVIGLAHALSRSPLADRVAGVDGNDVLYAGDPAYAADCKVVMLSALQALVACVEEMANAGAGDARARASLLAFLPTLLRDYREKILDVDAGAAATGLLEKLCLALKTADAAHPAVKETVAFVQRRLLELRKAAAAAAAPPPPPP